MLDQAACQFMPAEQASHSARITLDGRFFRHGNARWHIRGLTYGPFRHNDAGERFPAPTRAWADLALMQGLGTNAIRVYHLPPEWLIADANERGLKILIDVPWDKRRCFFEDYSTLLEARRAVRNAARLAAAHPAIFAISVAHEVPKDIVRYSGHRRVARFIDDLIDLAKQEAPECLATYTNYPSTEFLEPSQEDFVSFNIYLHDERQLGDYLDRLQHLAGPRPLILGEFGADSMRLGDQRQAEIVTAGVHRAHRHGLAGSFVFAFTDEWFAIDKPVTDWAFGITTAGRALKPAATALSSAWRAGKGGCHLFLPRVSVAVCSYNGAATLEECLTSLVRLNYPDYEVILIDDGSADSTSEIARRFPRVKYVRQENQGLSAARNAAARIAAAPIIAYTDSDCAVDEDWLLYLVTAMQDHSLDAAGGPNLPPPTDGAVSQCISASPGMPTHVMLDDRAAEHIPGCNMAFVREKLLATGGFDPQFRQAGDDVDICWRFLDAGLHIGYAPAAVVWHHRRATVRAFLCQQGGYGRAEAMLVAKHPDRFNAIGLPQWSGVIYGAPTSGHSRIRFGRFGTGLFQMAYRSNDSGACSIPLLIEWHLLAAFLLMLAVINPSIALGAVAMEVATVFSAARFALRARLPHGLPWWSRWLVGVLHIAQPIVRSAARYRQHLRRRRLPYVPVDDRFSDSVVRVVSLSRFDMYWRSDDGRGREALLNALREESERNVFQVSLDSQWSAWDAHVTGDFWHDVRVFTATEDLQQFTRARCEIRGSWLARIASLAAAIWTALALASGHLWLVTTGGIAALSLAALLFISAFRVRRAVSRLLWRSGTHARLENVAVDSSGAQDTDTARTQRTPVGECA